MEPELPEDVYLDAALAQQATWQPGEDAAYQRCIAERMAADPPFRAAVESAYRAGYGRGRDDEADGVATSFRPAPDDGDRYS